MNKNKLSDIKVPEAKYYEQEANRNIAITRYVHYELKKYCIQNGKELKATAEKAILEFLKKEELNNKGNDKA